MRMGEILDLGGEQALLMLLGMRRGKQILSGEVTPSETTKVSPDMVQSILGNIDFVLSYVRVHRFAEDLNAVMAVEGEAGHYARVGYLRLLTDSLEQVEKQVLRLVYGQLHAALAVLCAENAVDEPEINEADTDMQTDFSIVLPNEELQTWYDTVLNNLVTTYAKLIIAESEYTTKLESQRLNQKR